MTEQQARDTCPECRTERHVRIDGTFRLHAAQDSSRTCAGSHKPAPNVTAKHCMTDAERLRQIRALHSPSLTGNEGVWCAGCSEFVPCGTMRILDA